MPRRSKNIPHRFTIDLPEGLISELHEHYGEFRKNKKRFIEGVLREKLDADRKKKINELLVNGYKSRHNEDLATTKEFEASDMEGCNEY